MIDRNLNRLPSGAMGRTAFRTRGPAIGSTIGLTLLLALLGACVTTGPRVVSTYDPAAEFERFHTFAFVQPLTSDRDGARTTVSAALMTATTRELQARGLRLVRAQPDLLIDFYVAEQSRVAGSTASVSSSPFVHAHGGLTTWSGYDLGTSSRHRITEGTIIVDVVDARRRALVFEARAEDRVTEAMRDNLEETIASVIPEMFSGMP